MAKTPEAPKMKRRQQFAETFKMARKSDPRLVWWLLGAFVIGAAVGFGLFLLLPGIRHARASSRPSSARS